MKIYSPPKVLFLYYSKVTLIRLDWLLHLQLSFSSTVYASSSKLLSCCPGIFCLLVFITQWTVVDMSQDLALFCPKCPGPHRVLSTWYEMNKQLIITHQIQVTFQPLSYLKLLPAISLQISVFLWSEVRSRSFQNVPTQHANYFELKSIKAQKTQKDGFLFNLLKEILSDRKTCFMKGTLA